MNWKALSDFKYIYFTSIIVIFICCPFFLVNGLAEPVSVIASDSPDGTFWLWKLLGRLHPMAVHIPVTLLCLAAILEMATLRNFNSRLRPGIDLLVLFGALGAVLSVIFGWLLADQENYGGEILDLHKWIGIATGGLGIVTAALLYAIEKKELWRLVVVYRGILLFTAVGVTAAGHYGASLTHGEDYLTSTIPWSKDYERPADAIVLENGSALGSGSGTNKPKTDFIKVMNNESSKPGSAQLSIEQQIELTTQVRAIFAHNCYKCHSSDKIKGDLRLDQKDMVYKGGKSGPLFVAGSPENSELVRRITLPRGHKESMPGKGKALTEEEINLIKFWIKKGATWPDAGQKSVFRVAELKPREIVLPPAPKSLGHPIDRLVNDYFKKQKVKWPAVVNDKVYLKRIYLDIIGMVPTPEEINAFTQDKRPDKRAIWVRKLLDRNDDYAMHWLSFWNDALRNDYSGTGYITKGRFNISDWLYKSLATNKPYNIFVRELLNPTKESEGFIKGIQWRGSINSSQRTEMQAAQNVSQVFLGLNLKCASCHDSFVSDWKLEDAYAFANVFADTTLEINRCDVPTGKMADTRILWKELGTVDKNGKLADKLRQMSLHMTKPQNGRLYRTLVNRVWGQMLGRGIVAPVDEMDNKPWSQDLLDWMATDFVKRNYDVKELIYLIATSKTYQLPTVGIKDPNKITDKNFKFRGMLRRRLSAEQFVDAVSYTIQPVYSDSALKYNPFGKKELYTSKLPFARASLVKNDGFMTALGRPNRETVITGRDSQANLLQALELTNGKKFNDVLHRGAKSWIDHYKTNDQIIRAVYRQALGREPQTKEFKVAMNALGEKPEPELVQDFLWAVVLLPEFQFIY